MSELRNLSIVIPSYNGRALLRRTLRTLSVAAPEAEVIVVDGRSRDGSFEMVRDEFPEVVLLSRENHGFAHATNRGIERSTREFVLMMNSDLFASRAALESMMARLAGDRACGGVAPVLLNEDGTRQHVFGFFYWPNFAPMKRVARVPLLNGACLMTRRDVLHDIGLLDETFFLYNEEYDWCARATGAGYHLEIVPERVIHVGGGSTSRHAELTLEEHRGFMYMARKHWPTWMSEGLRLGMELESWCFSWADPRPAHRTMWTRLRGIVATESFRESTFPVSGRGDRPAQPAWLPRLPMTVSAPPAHAAFDAPITTTRPRPVAPAQASSAAPVAPDNVVRLTERLRLRAKAVAKVAGAVG